MDTAISQSYIMVADSHIAGDADAARFFDLLEKLSALPRGTGIVFLGDIFELWFALPYYEDERHERFLVWCRSEIARREILFLEGNHEFFCTKLRRDAFTEISRSSIRRGAVLFLHGDTIHRGDIPYLLLRMGVRNGLTRFLMRLTGKAFGPRLSQHIRKSLKTTNMVNKKKFPVNDVDTLLKRFKEQGIQDVFSGHFHDRKEVEKHGVRLHVLPAFSNTGEIGIFDSATRQYAVLPWEEAIQKITTNQGDKPL